MNDELGAEAEAARAVAVPVDPQAELIPGRPPRQGQVRQTGRSLRHRDLPAGWDSLGGRSQFLQQVPPVLMFELGHRLLLDRLVAQQHLLPQLHRIQAETG
jgi:hypothetical protein